MSKAPEQTSGLSMPLGRGRCVLSAPGRALSRKQSFPSPLDSAQTCGVHAVPPSPQLALRILGLQEGRAGWEEPVLGSVCRWLTPCLCEVQG